MPQDMPADSLESGNPGIRKFESFRFLARWAQQQVLGLTDEREKASIRRVRDLATWAARANMIMVMAIAVHLKLQLLSGHASRRDDRLWHPTRWRHVGDGTLGATRFRTPSRFQSTMIRRKPIQTGHYNLCGLPPSHGLKSLETLTKALCRASPIADWYSLL